MADRFWVGNGGNWSDTAHWSLTDGGASGASAPTNTDTAHFTANSITAGAQTINIDQLNVPALDFSAILNTPTLNIANAGAAGSIYGSLDLTGIGTLSASQQVILRGTGVHTIKTAGHVIPSTSWTISAPGGTYTLLDDFTRTAFAAGSDISVSQGTFDTGSKNLVLGTFSVVTGATLVLGASIITVKRINAVNLSLNGGAVFAPNTAVFKLDMAGTTNQTVTATNSPDMNGATLEILSIGTATLTLNGRAIWGSVIFPSAATTTIVANTLDAAFQGVAGRPIAVHSKIAASPATISVASGTILANHATITDITAEGGAAFRAYDSIDGGGNTGWTFVKAKKLAAAGVGV